MDGRGLAPARTEKDVLAVKKIKWHTLALSVIYLALGVFLVAAPGVTLNVVCCLIGGTVLVCGLGLTMACAYFSVNRLLHCSTAEVYLK